MGRNPSKALQTKKVDNRSLSENISNNGTTAMRLLNTHIFDIYIYIYMYTCIDTQISIHIIYVYT